MINVMYFHWFEQVRTGSNRFSDTLLPLNLGPNHGFGSAVSQNFEPDFSQFLKSSGPNRISELDWGHLYG